jgi:alpha-tubulin suppressor-like RCC1 family protein
VPVTGITTATAVAAGGYHSCALLSGGTVECWGWNNPGQLGNGTTVNSSTPVTVTGITNAVAITAGRFHSCALLSGGTVECWGDNYSGQLGNGTLTDSSTPVTVTGITSATAITAGDQHSCAVLSGGTVECWGSNQFVGLGNGANLVFSGGGVSSIPVTVIASYFVAMTNAIAVTAGYQHSCALLLGGTLRCWGYNYWGQLSNGTTYSSSVAQPVIGL